jgi:hypothetical protein
MDAEEEATDGGADSRGAVGSRGTVGSVEEASAEEGEGIEGEECAGGAEGTCSVSSVAKSVLPFLIILKKIK